MRRIRSNRLIVLAVAVAVASGASAATTYFERNLVQVASGTCGANNPANDASLRRLVTGLRNAGTTTVSVVCTQFADDNSNASPTLVYLYANNGKTTTANLTCTLSQGLPLTGQEVSTKTITVVGGATAAIFWTPSDYGTSSAQGALNIQCSVPAGFALREIGFTFGEATYTPPT